MPPAAGGALPPTPPSGNLNCEPNPRDCCSVCENISYLRMSLSLTERRANFIASSKCAFVISGTGSGESSVSMALGLASAAAASMAMKIAPLARRWSSRRARIFIRWPRPMT